MADDADGDGAERQPGAIGRFFKDLAKSLRSGAVGWISTGILGLIIAGGTYYWSQLRDTAKEFEISRSNISFADALAEARRSVGSRVQWVVPFRNRGDPTQYIAVWSAVDEGICDQNDDGCQEPLGSMRADLLVGNGGVYERVATPVRAGTDGFPIVIDDPQKTSQSARDEIFTSIAGVTDWNGD